MTEWRKVTHKEWPAFQKADPETAAVRKALREVFGPMPAFRYRRIK